MVLVAALGERETDARALKADTFFLLSFYFRTQTYVRHLREPSPVLVVGFGPPELGLVGLPPSDPSLSISLTGSVVRLAKKINTAPFLLLFTPLLCWD